MRMMTRAWYANFQRAAAEDRTRDGIVFHSVSERDRFDTLVLMQHAGEIANLKRQVRFPLVLPGGRHILIRSPGYPKGRTASYTVDFKYDDVASGETIYEEWKKFDDSYSRLRRAVAEACYDITIRVEGSPKTASSVKRRRITKRRKKSY